MQIQVGAKKIEVLRYRRLDLALSAQSTMTRYVPVLMGDFPNYYVPITAADAARLINAGYEKVA